MTYWIVTSCAVSDGADLARNNMSAFWEDPTWKLLWPKFMAKEFIIEQCSKRVPRNLLQERSTLRHQKAVDPETGALMGYARWVLPQGRVVRRRARVGGGAGVRRGYAGEAEDRGELPRCVVGAKGGHGCLG